MSLNVPPRILLLGANGQVGWELQRSLAPLGELIPCDRARCDMEKPDQLQATLEEHRPDIIVNASAHTAVDRAESEPQRAQRINADALGEVGRWAATHHALVIHYSTDYVFDGSGERPFSEQDATGPLSVYGRTKLDGEKQLAASGAEHLIFRTSWVYAARGGNFAKTMLRLAAEREQLKVVCDQIGAPTSAELIADVTALALQRYRLSDRPQAMRGIYHLTASGSTSWQHYARFVIAQALTLGQSLRCTPEQVLPIPTADYPTPARRPLNSRLNTEKLQTTLNIELPSWETGVNRMLNELFSN